MRRIVSTVAWLPVWALVLAVHPALAIQRPHEHPPNIIVFVGDDLGWRDTEPYGNTAVRTPNIARLARVGLLVRYAFGTSPQCSPSRISMLSGRYPHVTRTEDLHTPLPDGVRLLPALLQTVAYFTGHMAKTHYGPNGERQFQWYSPETAPAPRFPRIGGSPDVLPLGGLSRAAPAVSDVAVKANARAGPRPACALPRRHAGDARGRRPVLRRDRAHGREDRRDDGGARTAAPARPHARRLLGRQRRAVPEGEGHALRRRYPDAARAGLAHGAARRRGVGSRHGEHPSTWRPRC